MKNRKNKKVNKIIQELNRRNKEIKIANNKKINKKKRKEIRRKKKRTMNKNEYHIPKNT